MQPEDAVEVDWGLIDQHAQKYRTSCVPSCVEMVLKLLGRMPADSFECQDELGSERDAGFGDYARTIRGVSFTQRFTSDRGPGFPLDDLFAAIRAELGAGRFVLASLPSGQLEDGTMLCHMWVVHAEHDRELVAFSKSGPATITCERVCAEIAALGGTDILTYEVVGDPDA